VQALKPLKPCAAVLDAGSRKIWNGGRALVSGVLVRAMPQAGHPQPAGVIDRLLSFTLDVERRDFVHWPHPRC
jgi:hypothetical protein